jgi:ribosomal protein L7/L12
LSPSQRHEVMPPAQVDEALQALVREGRKIEAIKLHREHTGLGLRESKDHIDALESRKAPVAAARPPPATAQRERFPPAQLDEALQALVREGRKIEAIKLHREQTGLGLRESKSYVDALEARSR